MHHEVSWEVVGWMIKDGQSLGIIGKNLNSAACSDWMANHFILLAAEKWVRRSAGTWSYSLSLHQLFLRLTRLSCQGAPDYKYQHFRSVLVSVQLCSTTLPQYQKIQTTLHTIQLCSRSIFHFPTSDATDMVRIAGHEYRISKGGRNAVAKRQNARHSEKREEQALRLMNREFLDGEEMDSTSPLDCSKHGFKEPKLRKCPFGLGSMDFVKRVGGGLDGYNWNIQGPRESTYILKLVRRWNSSPPDRRAAVLTLI